MLNTKLITILVNPSYKIYIYIHIYKIQLLNVKHKIKIVSFKKFSEVGETRFTDAGTSLSVCVIHKRHH